MYDIDQLDVRIQRMDACRLQMVAAIVERNHKVYKLSDVRLMDAMKRTITDDEDEALRKVVVVAINSRKSGPRPLLDTPHVLSIF